MSQHPAFQFSDSMGNSSIIFPVIWTGRRSDQKSKWSGFYSGHFSKASIISWFPIDFTRDISLLFLNDILMSAKFANTNAAQNKTPTVIVPRKTTCLLWNQYLQGMTPSNWIDLFRGSIVLLSSSSSAYLWGSHRHLRPIYHFIGCVFVTALFFTRHQRDRWSYLPQGLQGCWSWWSWMLNVNVV